MRKTTITQSSMRIKSIKIVIHWIKQNLANGRFLFIE